MSDGPRMLTIREVATTTGVDEKTVRRAIDRGDLAAYDFATPGTGRRVLRVDPTDLDAWKQARRYRPRPRTEPAVTVERPAAERGTLAAARARRGRTAA